MHRRRFLYQLGLWSGGVAIGSHAWAASLANPNPKRLVVVFLRGAVDGLNVLVPYTDANYYRLRPTIAIPRPGQNQGALDLNGQFGLHPALGPLMDYWQEGNLAFIPAAGSPNDTRSHFEAQRYMETGTPEDKKTTDGWLNRLLGVLPQQGSPIQALNVGNTTPTILTGRATVASLAPGAVNRVLLDRPAIAAHFDRLYSGQDALSQTYREGRRARQEIMSALAMETQEANNNAPPGLGFARDAQRLGQLMRRDRSVQIGFMAIGGWDTHINQGSSQGQLAGRLRLLAEGLDALVLSLGQVYSETVIVILSEFGRTAAENGNRGTDHGRGNVMMVLGGPIKGTQVAGPWPGLAPEQLYQRRDLAITVDFRAVLSQVLRQHLQLNDAQLARVFPGYQTQQLEFSLL